MNTKFKVGDLFICQYKHNDGPCGCYVEVTDFDEKGLTIDYVIMRSNNRIETNQFIPYDRVRHANLMYLGHKSNKLVRLFYNV